MKLPQLLTRKKLRATTARRALGAAEMDYEEMSEPNMKLSRALLIVLVLHVVAVAGIIAFNTIKTRQGPLPYPSGGKNEREETGERERGPLIPPTFRRRAEMNQKPPRQPPSKSPKNQRKAPPKKRTGKKTFSGGQRDHPDTTAG